MSVFEIQGWILSVVSIVLFAVHAWAFIDAVSHRAEAFPAAGKMTKAAWATILGLALAAHMLIWNPISLLNIIGTVAALVYLTDVRPALRELTRGR